MLIVWGKTSDENERKSLVKNLEWTTFNWKLTFHSSTSHFFCFVLYKNALHITSVGSVVQWIKASDWRCWWFKSHSQNCLILSSNISKYKFSIEIYSSEIFHLIPIRGFSLNHRRFIEELNLPITKSIRVEFSSYRPASAFVWWWKDFQNHRIDR